LAVERAREMGLCFGVRRAIRLLEEAARRFGSLDTLGPVVHNRRVVERLEGMGIRVAGGPKDLENRVVAISSHGLGPLDMKALEGREVIDATCPIVARAQKAARDLGRAGFQVVVFGDSLHPEVKGLLGWAGDGALATESPLRLEPWPKRLGLLSQTTQNPEAFSSFIASALPAALDGGVELRIVNTICQPTRRRQASALELARRAEVMVVVGGKTSANTRRLAELCSPLVEVHLVETAEDINPAWIRGKESIGLSAGASTPDEVIMEVEARLRALAGRG
jgi:4-hydroxy-3-methylbut-2-enyl diphosphate reductase